MLQIAGFWTQVDNCRNMHIGRANYASTACLAQFLWKGWSHFSQWCRRYFRDVYIHIYIYICIHNIYLYCLSTWSSIFAFDVSISLGTTKIPSCSWSNTNWCLLNLHFEVLSPHLWSVETSKNSRDAARLSRSWKFRSRHRQCLFSPTELGM